MSTLNKLYRKFLLRAVSGLALTAGAMYALPALSAAPAKVQAMEEIVVTAQKREERLQDVPVAVTAVTAKTLEANRFELLSDLNGLAPNVYLNSGLVGQNSIIATIRGLASTPVFPGQSEGVSFYLDGVYLGNIYGDLLDLADVQQIEALKGPQGTLFGRSSLGGAISIATTNPTGAFHMSETLSGGNYDQFRSKTHVELPQVGPFSANFTFLHFQRTGDIKNLGAGTVWDLGAARNSLPFGGSSTHNSVFTSPKTLGDQNTNAFAGTLRFHPVDNIDVIYKFDYSKDDYTPYGNGVAVIGNSNFSYLFQPQTNLAALIAAQPAGTRVPVVNTTRPAAVNDNFDGPSTEENYGHNLTLTWRANDMFTVKDIVAYRHNHSIYDANTIGTGGLTNEAGAGIPYPFVAGSPWVEPVSDDDYSSHQFTNELQINTTTKWFNLTSGWMYYDEHGQTKALKQITFPNTYIPPNALFPGSPAFGGSSVSGAGTKASPYVLPSCAGSTTDQYTSCGIPLFFNLGDERTHAFSQAVYSQAQFHLTSQIDFIAGGRMSWDEEDAGGDGGPTGQPYEKQKDKAPTYALGVDYRPTSDMMLYVKYSTGFIPGGIFNQVPYAPETALSYEGGIKADWLEHTLRTNVAVFDVNYAGYQVFTFFPKLSLTNSGSQRASGFEFEGAWLPVHGVTLGANVGYTNTVSDDRASLTHATVVAFVPTWTVNLNGQYQSSPLDWAAGGRFLVHADANHTSAIHLSAGCIAQVFAVPASLACSDTFASQAATTVGPQWLVNGRVALTDIQGANVMSMPTTWEIALWVKNLTDNKSLTQSTYQSRTNSYGAGWQPARTFGIDVKAKF